MDATYVSIDRWRDKEDVVCEHTHTHGEILLSHEKEQINAICSNMDRPREYHT